MGSRGGWGQGDWWVGIGDRVKEVWGPRVVGLKGLDGDQGVGVDRMVVKGRRSKVVEI